MEKHILLSAKNGDTAAFEMIVSAYEQKIFRFIATMVGPVQAEDLTQETFLKLYKNIPKYNAEKAFNAWVYTIARTTVYDWLRKEQKRKDRHIIDDANHPFEPANEKKSQQHTLDRIASKLDMRQAIASLDPKYKEIIVLYYWEEYTYDDIAHLLGVSINTVKTRVRRAKQHLREIIEASEAV